MQEIRIGSVNLLVDDQTKSALSIADASGVDVTDTKAVVRFAEQMLYRAQKYAAAGERDKATMAERVAASLLNYKRTAGHTTHLMQVAKPGPLTTVQIDPVPPIPADVAQAAADNAVASGRSDEDMREQRGGVVKGMLGVAAVLGIVYLIVK